MRILIAEDEALSRQVLQSVLKKWGYEVVATDNGQSALDILEGPEPPEIALLDWSMPQVDGVTVCKRVRAGQRIDPTYVIFVTAKASSENVVAGLQAGADDYICKPFDRDELKARLQVGVRIIELQRALTNRVRQLEESLAQITKLRRLLPICSYCHKVRADQDYWQQVEEYLTAHSAVQFSHSICPDCWGKHVVPQLQTRP
jgi:sigma-B regulation protein RsbU (phosphoserine phosphatase)